MQQLIAFLRGINGGVTVKMADLRDAFEQIGFTQVKTVLATGNVIFEATESDRAKVATRIEKMIANVFDYQTSAIIMTPSELRRLVANNPFGDLAADIQHAPQISFVKGGVKGSELTIPLDRSQKGYTLVGASKQAVFSILDLSGATRPDLLSVLDKAFGKNVTTRNWQTIKRVRDALEGTY